MVSSDEVQLGIVGRNLSCGQSQGFKQLVVVENKVAVGVRVFLHGGVDIRPLCLREVECLPIERRRQRIIVFNVGCGWEELCRSLGVHTEVIQDEQSLILAVAVSFKGNCFYCVAGVYYEVPLTARELA